MPESRLSGPTAGIAAVEQETHSRRYVDGA
jgi:hypothetical protein